MRKRTWILATVALTATLYFVSQPNESSGRLADPVSMPTPIVSWYDVCNGSPSSEACVIVDGSNYRWWLARKVEPLSYKLHTCDRADGKYNEKRYPCVWDVDRRGSSTLSQPQSRFALYLWSHY